MSFEEATGKTGKLTEEVLPTLSHRLSAPQKPPHYTTTHHPTISTLQTTSLWRVPLTVGSWSRVSTIHLLFKTMSFVRGCQFLSRLSCLQVVSLWVFSCGGISMEIKVLVCHRFLIQSKFTSSVMKAVHLTALNPQHSKTLTMWDRETLTAGLT